MAEIIEANWSQDLDLAGIFSELGDNCKIAIARMEPEWCAGHVRTVHFDPKEPISMDWIQKKFGGEKLQVRLYGPKSATNKSGYLTARTIDIMGPPRDGNGVEMTQGPDGKAVKVPELEMAIERYNQKLGIDRKNAQAVEPPAIQNTPDMTLFQVLIESQSAQHATMLQMMGQRVQTLEDLLYKQHAVQQGPPINAVDQLKSTMETFTMMDKMRGKLASPESEDSDSLMPMIGQIVQGFMAKNTAQNMQQRPSGRLKPPGGSPKELPTRATNPIKPAMIPSHETENRIETDESLSGMANNLSRLDADDAAEVVIEAIGNMPLEKRERAMKTFFESMNPESELDDSSTDDDTISHEETLDDPFSVTQIGPVPVPGGESLPDEKNDQVDRTRDPKGLPVSPH